MSSVRTAWLILMVFVLEMCLMIWHLDAKDDEDDFDPYWDISDWKLRP